MEAALNHLISPCLPYYQQLCVNFSRRTTYGKAICTFPHANKPRARVRSHLPAPFSLEFWLPQRSALFQPDQWLSDSPEFITMQRPWAKPHAESTVSITFCLQNEYHFQQIKWDFNPAKMHKWKMHFYSTAISFYPLENSGNTRKTLFCIFVSVQE